VKFRHAGVLSSDLDKSKEFYAKLGFKVVKENHLDNRYIQTLLGIPGLTLTYVKMCLPPDTTPLFELHHWTHTDVIYGLKNKYTAHIALTYEGSLKSFYLKHNSDIKFISEPLRATDSKCKVCFIEDPDGNLVELVEDPKK